jgi:hypothetical protein
MRINRVFDFFGPVSFVPNGWNYKFTNILWGNNFHIYHKSIDDFNKEYQQISIFDCNLNLPEDIMEFLSISEIYLDNDGYVSTKNIKKDENFFYTIHPFGDVYTCLGQNSNYHEHVSVFDNISQKAKDLSHSKNFYIIFDYSTEGDINSDIFYYIHSACEKNNINIENVIVISSAQNTYDLYNDFYVKEKNADKKLKAVFYPWSLLSKSKDTNKILFEDRIIEFGEYKNENSLMTETDVLRKNRPKKSLCLNRRLSHHRIILISLLLDGKYNEDSLISFDTNMLFSDDIIIDLINDTDDITHSFLNDKTLKQKCINGFRKMKKIGKNVVDYDDIQNVWGFAFEQKESYLDSYFSIVTETLFYRPGNYISEKTWKPIAHLHPFIIVGRPHTLKFLKSLGFKTFSEFWDESYDDETLNSVRMEKVYQIISNLLNMTNEEWDNLYDKLIPILLYNRKKLLEFGEKPISHIYYKNLNKLINETNQKTYSLIDGVHEKIEAKETL